MSNSNCSVIGCKNTYRNTQMISPKVIFYSFPNRPYESERKIKWIKFCKRKCLDGKAWNPTKHSKICSMHFIGNRKSNHPLNPNYIPTIYSELDITKAKLSSLRRFERLANRRLIVPKVSTFEDNLPEVVPHKMMMSFLGQIGTEDLTVKMELVTFDCVHHQQCTVSTQIESSLVKEQLVNTCKVNTKDACVGSNFRLTGFKGFDTIRNNNRLLEDLTSVNLKVFSMLSDMLQQDVKTCELSSQDKLLLTLMKLKLGLSFETLASFFNVHRTTGMRTFRRTVAYLVQRTKEFIVWPTKEINASQMFKCFKKDYKFCRTIIHSIEIYCEKPMDVNKQKDMYSSYKQTYTIKYLIGITPGGLVSFISKGYGGSASDLDLTKDCGILDLLESEDIVLADKDYPSIKTMLSSKNVNLIVPPLAHPNQNQFSVEDMCNSQKISACRLNVKNLIRRFKVFNILQNRVPCNSIDLMDDILRLIGVIISLQPGIAKQ